MAAEQTRHVMLFGLDVHDDDAYRRYRAAMTPILHAHGGSFGYDFVVSRVLQSQTSAAINRVFTLMFPDASVASRFFADSTYREARAQHFERAVRSVTALGAFDEAGSAGPKR